MKRFGFAVLTGVFAFLAVTDAQQHQWVLAVIFGIATLGAARFTYKEAR